MCFSSATGARLAAIKFQMISHQPVLDAGSQHGAFHFSIRFWLALSPCRAWIAGAENGDIRAVTRKQRQRGATETAAAAYPISAK